ncbi:MAG: DUF5411 family protein [Candidatus Faecenecus gallistercoris]|nr:DUF5411 family protein [Bacillota bacterium]MDD7103148.1 DUF5411 family protein [Bacillota bacterium]MDY4050879.1 DUF5411 family protein [Candidatus Faecenecus gallistercoris]CDE08027.1 unknown [Bacillus sp. CAG:988]
MSKGVMAAGIIMLGVLTFGLINIISNYTTGNELDFQLLRDTTESAMLDAVDLGFFQTSGGQIRMDKEKFVEGFVRRFAQSVNNDRNYQIEIYDINETPPKASVRVGSSTMATFADVSFNIENRVDAIIETKYTDPRTLDEVTNYD